MRIWTPEECKAMYRQGTDYYSPLHPFTVFDFDKHWLPDKLDILTRGYAHDDLYVTEALELTEWPDMDYIKERLSIYLLKDPSYDHYNGSAGAYWKREKDDLLDMTPHGHVLLYGRSTPIPRFMTHYILIHELGHVIQETYAHEHEQKGRALEYFKLRGIPLDDERIPQKDPDWILCWKQLWAEDWRWLFGLGSAHQNTWSMGYPLPGPEIKEWMLSLIARLHKNNEVA